MVFFGTPSRTEILDLQGFDQTLNYISESAGTTAAHTIADSVGTGRLTLNDNGVTNDWTGIVISGGSLVKNGNGTLILEQNQTYTGPTTINGGVLQVGIGGANGSLATSSVTNNGTLIFNSTSASSLPDLYGSGGLQVLGSGGLSINGPYPYSGPTIISNGPLTLSANGVFSNSPSITLANSAASLNAMGGGGVLRSAGQSLTGSGTVQGDVLAAPGSTITVGNSVGTLTLNGNATFDTATINMELGADPSTVGGTVNDLISVTGGLTLANVSTVYVTPVAALNTATPYTLMQYGTLSGLASNLNVTLPSAGRYTFTVQDPATTAPYIKVGVTATLAGNLMWRGGNAVDPTRWDVATTTNWLNGGVADKFLDNDPVAFDDSAVTNRATLTGSIVAASLVASNNSLSYTLDGSGPLTLKHAGHGRQRFVHDCQQRGQQPWKRDGEQWRFKRCQLRSQHFCECDRQRRDNDPGEQRTQHLFRSNGGGRRAGVQPADQCDSHNAHCWRGHRSQERHQHADPGGRQLGLHRNPANQQRRAQGDRQQCAG